jgi:beta-catenin-like protein 1
LIVDQQILIDGGDEVTSEDEELWYLRRLDSGLFTLQTVDYILAWLAMDDDGVGFQPCLSFSLTFAQVRNHMLQMMNRKNQSLQDIVETLKIFHLNVDDDAKVDSDGGSLSQKMILQGLIESLGGEI